MFFGNSLISWKSKYQQTVARSSAEAEYRSLAALANELTWLKSLLVGFGVDVGPGMVYCDNQSAIHISSNPTFHEQTKHIDIDCHFIQEKVLQGLTKLVHIPSVPQLADALTKPLSRPQFSTLVSKMGIKNIFFPS